MSVRENTWLYTLREGQVSYHYLRKKVKTHCSDGLCYKIVVEQLQNEICSSVLRTQNDMIELAIR